MRLAALILLLAPVAYGQVFQVGAGSSTLYGNSGAIVTTYLPGQTITTSAGVEQGIFRFTLADAFRARGFDWTIGDRQFFFLTGSTGEGVSVRGVSVGRHTDHSELTVFLGAAGTLYTSPFFQGFGQAHFGAGIFYQRKFAHVTIASLESVQGSKRTALESAVLTWRGVRLIGAAGILQNAREGNFQGEWRAPHFAAVASHNVYHLAPLSYSVDSLSVSGGAGGLSGGASAFRGSQDWQESVFGSYQVGWLAIRETWAQGAGPITGASETFRHWTITENYAHGALALGGGFRSNRLTAAIGQNLFFDLLSGRFVESTTATLTLNVANATANLGTLVGAGQGARYTAAVSDFLGAPREGHVQGASIGRYLITGTVRDAHGQPIEGAAVQVGRLVYYTDASGSFQARVRKDKPQPVEVLLSEFAAPGKWRVLSAPASAAPGSSIEIIVAH